MFPKECFNGQDKKLAKSHWAEFSKYLDYQSQQGTIPRDLAHLPEIKSMFKLTLQDIALGWFETEEPTWLTEDQMKQSFLKRLNPWGDTRRQQQDAWNKLKFDMTKDDVDSFVIDMKTLASILGHNDDVVMEKFKDVFPDPNIEAALIAMDDFALMQKKAKQLVHIYKPAHDSPMASPAILVHTADKATVKSKSSQPKNNQHQLAPINQSQTSDNHCTSDNDYNGGQRSRGRGNYRGPVDVEIVETLITDMTIKNMALEKAKGNMILITVEGVVKIIHIEDDEDSGMEMTQITVTETIGIEIPIVKVILTGVEDGIITVEVKDIVIVEEGDDGIPISSIMIKGTNRNPNIKIHTTTDHPLWDINIDTQPHMVSIRTHPNNNNTHHKCQRLLNKPLTSVNCAIVQGHYDYQCQFAGDFYGTHTKSFQSRQIIQSPGP